MKTLPLALILFTSFVAPAFAADGDDIRKATECRPAKDIIKLFSKFDKLKPMCHLRKKCKSDKNTCSTLIHNMDAAALYIFQINPNIL